MDGRDFTASYHSNIEGKRDGGGNDRVFCGECKEEYRIVEIRDVRYARYRSAFAPFCNFTCFIVDICMMMQT